MVTREYIDRAESDAILQKPFDISVVTKEKTKHWFFREKEVFTKHTFQVHPMKLAQQQRIMGRLADINVHIFEDIDNLMKVYGKLVSEHMDDVVYCVSVMLSDARMEPTRELQEFVKLNFDNNDLEAVWAVMVKQMNPGPFTNGIILMKGIDLNEVNPRA
ncbi:hypothetical protein LL912_00900 [Niabella sp. CC-SYL272]|uniref:hypothetical protein n=1 Tax=Niabella agricola TaxID=2891571 RepID=UPI001F317818|nr:hypothetical protein [Niabella agricola]MCF3107325.1 hypothetical protein [Niabella agricola]